MNMSVTGLSNYEINTLIYQSDRTLVYRGRKTNDRRPVVIKLMQRKYPTFNELIQFRNQYAIVKNLDVEGIVKPYALERYQNRYALIMEDFGGISLDEYYRNASVSVSEFLALSIQLSQILHQLHQNRVIHKDIKPANILIHPETQEVKLIDFSISSLLPKETTTLQTPNVLEGTLAYISPEQTGRMNRGIDYRSDFYGLGVTFYQLLNGNLPFETNDALELVHCHIAKMPAALGKRGVVPAIPGVLSDIVFKLMAKNAEDRYQSALGLKYDLEKCLTQWQEKGTIEAFELGERDLSDRFLIPEKLYGRETEVQILLDAFDRVSKGNSELLLVAGYSGVGKTAVINEAHKPITSKRGYFIKGKFDQFQRNIPFFAFVQAFRDLMRQLLAESDAQLENWKQQIIDAVGENGQVIIEVIPELEAIIGKQPPVPQLEGSAAQNRFNLLFPKFFGVFMSSEHPLTMFIDDLQWGDSASLSLLKLLMNESERGYLLILGAYRDNEVFPAHPLMLTLEEIQKNNAFVQTLTLAPLDEANINCLVADTLLCSTEIAAPLSELVYQKTRGNPFFITQFLKGLYEDSWIIFDTEARYWQCDLAQVRQLALTDDVVEFMMRRLHKLPQETQNVLKLGACIGAEFDLATLAVACQKSQDRVAADLWLALQEDFVMPKSQTYKFFQGSEETDIAEFTVEYRFLHDRVQQAAYSLIPDDQKQTTHYRIGQLLLQQIPPEVREERIFELVNQLNYGTALIASRQQRDELAGLNLVACRKARAATAYQAGREYARTGLSLLGENPWQRQYKMSLEFHEIAAELASLCGDFEAMEQLIETAIARADSVLARVNVYRIRIQSNISQNKPSVAIAIGQQFLQQLGIAFPEAPTPKDIQEAIAEIGQLIQDREIQDLIHLPPMTDSEKIAIVQIASSIISAASIAGSPLFPLAVALSVKLSIQYGNTSASAFAYVCYGIFACSLLQDVNTGVQFGQLALEVVSQQHTKAVKPEVLFVAGFYTLHRKSHLKELLPFIRDGYAIALEVGNQEYAGYSAQSCCLTSFWCGQSLTALEQETRDYCNGLMQLNQLTTANWCRIYWQVILNLLGSGENPSILSGTALEEAEFLPSLTSARDLFGLYLFYLYKLMLSYLFGEIELAKSHALEVKNYVVPGAGSLGEPAFYFYDSLTELAGLRIEAEGASEALALVEQNQTQLQQQWARYAPMNHQHKVDLVAAEKARVLGNIAEAIELYDRAIAGAKENQFIHEEALAHELAAKFYLDWGKEIVASGYMQKAYYGYAQWGAKAKIKDLEKRYPQLLSPILQSDRPSRTSGLTIAKGTNVSNTSTMSSLSSILDFSSLLKASQTLSGEIELQSLLSTLMDVIVQSAGATKGALLLLAKGGLTVEAMATTTAENTLEIDSLRESIPLKQSENLPVGLINYVRHTKEMALLDANAARIQFGGDAYIIRNSPQSLLCFPILGRRESMPENSSRLIGILYLENTVTANAFTNDRLELLNALCAQAAISLENARLYQQAQQALADLQNAQLQLVQNEKMATLGNLVAGVAHEINNPLTFISGNVEISIGYLEDIFSILERYRQEYSNPSVELTEEIEERDLDFLLEDFPQVIASMETGVERIRNISISLRTFSRTDTDAKSELNLRDGMESTLLILKYRLKANEERPAIEVVKNYGDVPPIQCYPGQLNQVFMNLLANAIDAMEEGNAGRSFDEIKANPNRIGIQTYRDGERAVVKIADNGTGMPEEVKERIFDQGFTTKAVGKGTGLGMAISHQIVVEKHGGTITCASESGKGTEFIISLPLSN